MHYILKSGILFPLIITFTCSETKVYNSFYEISHTKKWVVTHPSNGRHYCLNRFLRYTRGKGHDLREKAIQQILRMDTV